MKSTGILSLLFVLFSSFNASAIHVDEWVTSDNGCKWHITGEIEVSIFSMEISSWDVDMSGPCGDFHFTGGIMPNTGGNTGVSAAYKMKSISKDPDVKDMDRKEMYFFFRKLQEIVRRQ